MPLAEKTYTLTVTNNNGCSATASTAVTVNPTTSPVINLSSNSPVCDGSVLSFTVTPQITGSYSLTFPDGFISTTQNTQDFRFRVISPRDQGTYTLSVINGSTCLSTSATTSVVINPLPPAPTISGGSSATLCGGSTFTLTGTAASNLCLQWVRSPETTNNLGTGLTQVVDKSGSYRLRATDQIGCSSFSSPSSVVIADYVFSGGITSTDSKQIGRISRSGIPTNCASTLDCQLFSSTRDRKSVV